MKVVKLITTVNTRWPWLVMVWIEQCISGWNLCHADENLRRRAVAYASGLTSCVEKCYSCIFCAASLFAGKLKRTFDRSFIFKRDFPGAIIFNIYSQKQFIITGEITQKTDIVTCKCGGFIWGAIMKSFSRSQDSVKQAASRIRSSTLYELRSHCSKRVL